MSRLHHTYLLVKTSCCAANGILKQDIIRQRAKRHTGILVKVDVTGTRVFWKIDDDFFVSLGCLLLNLRKLELWIVLVQLCGDQFVNLWREVNLFLNLIHNIFI